MTFSAPQDTSFLTDPFPGMRPRRVLPKSGLELTVVGTTRVLARSPGKLPSATAAHAENIRPLTAEESARVWESLQRGIAASVRKARAESGKVAG